jgi:hypothetical protein
MDETVSNAPNWKVEKVQQGDVRCTISVRRRYTPQRSVVRATQAALASQPLTPFPPGASFVHPRREIAIPGTREIPPKD